jgi:hypothetical protein
MGDGAVLTANVIVIPGSFFQMMRWNAWWME